MRWLKRSSYTENAGRNLLNASEATLRKDGSVEFADVEEGSLDSNHLEAPRRRQLQADQTLRQWRPCRRRRPLPSRTQVRRRRPRVLPRSGSHRRAYSPSTADDEVRCGDRRYVRRSAQLASAAGRDEPRFQLDSRCVLLHAFDYLQTRRTMVQTDWNTCEFYQVHLAQPTTRSNRPPDGRRCISP